MTVREYAETQGKDISFIYKKLRQGKLPLTFNSHSEKICLECGGEYRPTSNRSSFCSIKCRNRNQYKRVKDSEKYKAKIRRNNIKYSKSDKYMAMRMKHFTKQNLRRKEQRDSRIERCQGVYIVGYRRGNEWIAKVGYTGIKDLEKFRLKQIQTGCPEKLEVIYFQTFDCTIKQARDLEVGVRNMFPKTAAGNEWVVIPSYDAERLKALCI